ncbi:MULTISPECIES: hypothetical protein [Methylosinus]|uniref:Uncharacterized protein n=1 Tax=Methylosinus sporium TaxID=428 RepID=A0A2U1SQB9_METSR|nr:MULTISPECIES: hypothetical protein [Methylosinus]MBU3888898.1 hypothetical protein [Methylosinus sp. KRF6]PWB93806.1 hypothetical protein C5689_11040 [Methylosinus sporium]TRL29021.1 hypothetical protein FM996_17725 [Methylosinus sporium]
MKARLYALAALALLLAPHALASEIHLDCGRTGRTVAIDIDTGRRFVQLIWEDGVAEEYRDGDSYVSGASGSSDTQKVTYAVSVDKDAVSFGQDRICVAASGKCRDQHIRNLLDTAAGTLKYDDGGVIAVMKCALAPPGRRF